MTAEMDIESQAFTRHTCATPPSLLSKDIELARWFSIPMFAKTNIYVRRHYKGVSLKQQL